MAIRVACSYEMLIKKLLDEVTIEGPVALDLKTELSVKAFKILFTDERLVQKLVLELVGEILDVKTFELTNDEPPLHPELFFHNNRERVGEL